MYLSDTAKNKRYVDNLRKKASNRLVEQELPEIPGAVKRFEKLEKQVKALKKQVKGQEKRIEKLMAEKIQHEMGGG